LHCHSYRARANSRRRSRTRSASSVSFFIMRAPPPISTLSSSSAASDVYKRQHPDAKNVKHRSGDLYDMISAKPEASRPATEWSTCLLYTSPSPRTVLDLVCRLLLEKKKIVRHYRVERSRIRLILLCVDRTLWC